MRRRTRGRGNGRGSRGGANSRTNATSSSTVKPTTIQALQRQSSPYARQPRGGRGGKSATSNSNNMRDNHSYSMTNNGPAQPNGSPFGPYIKLQTNPVHDRLNGSTEYYLHKKFKKLTPATDSLAVPDSVPVLTNGFHEPKNGISIPVRHLRPGDTTKVLYDYSQLSSDILNNNSSSSSSNGGPRTSTSAGSVYKPKFRMSPEKVQSQPEVEEPVHVRTPVYPIPVYDFHQSSTSGSITVTVSTAMGSRNNSSPNTTTTQSQSAAGLVGGCERRLDRQSLDDRISKIIHENQSILATWPEHLNKRAKGQTSRTNSQSSSSSSSRAGSVVAAEILPLHRTLESRAQSLGFDLPSYPGIHPKGQLLRSNSDLSSLIQVHRKSSGELSDSAFSSGLALANGLVLNPESGFMVPKKRRRLSPQSRILCGGEVSELPVESNGVVNLSNTTGTRSLYQQQAHSDLDMMVRVSNCGNSGAKVTIRAGGGQSSSSSPTSLRYGNDESSNSSASSASLFSPRIRIRQDSIMEVESAPSPSPVPVPVPQKKSRGRPPRKPKQEAPNSQTPSVIVDNSCPDKSGPPLQITIKDNQVPARVPNGPNQPGKPDKSCLLLQTSALNPKRPTFLALKPINALAKEPAHGALPSPDTPRGAKTYNQMYISGHAYTYLGFKVSTKSSYTCLFRPQPMFVPQDTDAKLSMYSNWQARPQDPNAAEFKISTNDSSVNGRQSPNPLYIFSRGTSTDTLTVNSPDRQAPIFSPLDENCVSYALVGPPSPPPPQAIMRLPAPASQQSPSPVPSTSKSVVATAGALSPCVPSALPFSSTSNFIKAASASPKNGLKSPLPPVKVKGSRRKNYNSSSDSSSDDEECGDTSFRKPRFQSMSLCLDSETDLDRPLSLSMSRERPRSQSVSLSSPSAILHNLQNGSPAVRVMEGGFESNEDYTYVRGRGRGRYVCEACGIRCKKPSMLRKHLKTHTDLRPYTCKLCNFSFKTKGNLTKHQKSKSHHKKCIGLGIHPNSSRSLEMTGPISDTNTSDESDEDDDEDDKEDSDSNDSYNIEAETDRFEKEIAMSLLDLSQMNRFPEEHQKLQQQAIEANLVPVRKIATVVQPALISPPNPPDKAGPCLEDAPIDLSVKAVPKSMSPAPLVIHEPPLKRIKLDKRNGLSGIHVGSVKSMEIVGEAQRWEPEEDFLKNGCLNLTKIRNVDVEVADEMLVKIERPESVSPQSSPEKARDFEYEITKRRRTSSAGSSGAHYEEPKVVAVAVPKRTPPPQPRPQRLHQPWLSPQGQGPVPAFPEENGTSDSRERTESFNSSVSSNSESVSGLKDELENGIESTREFLPAVELSPGPNAKLFAGLIGLKPQAEFRQPSGAQAFKDEGKAECNVCGKTFARASQLTLHMNIHYLERPFRCDPCGVSFRTKGHLVKHRRSSSHDCKVYLTEAWGVANEENPRPFKCPECKIAFRIHGHLAKHLRSKMHIMRMECLGKLPFGIYFEMEKSGLNLNEIDTTDCDMSLVSLQNVAKKIYGDTWMDRLTIPIEEDPV